MSPGQSQAQIWTLEGSPNFVQNTMEAAALCACGVPIKTFKTARESSGAVEWRFEYNPQQRVNLANVSERDVLINETGVPCSSLTANQLMHAYRTGGLELVDPTHPYLDAMRALRNRERLLRWILPPHAAAQLVKHCACARWQYESAPLAALPVSMTASPLITREIKIVCGLGVIGYPLARITGPISKSTFQISDVSFMEGPDLPTATHLIHLFTTGQLAATDPDHPLFIIYSALEVMQKLKRHMQLEIANIWLEKPRSKRGRSAFVRADATPKALDTIYHHFRRGD